jgi:hypothetical protein
MNETSTARDPFGTVTDYATGEAIRPATRDELARTEAKLASDDSDNYTGGWVDQDGRAVYVNADHYITHESA